MYRALAKPLTRAYTLLALVRWRIVYAETVISTCIQRVWRGFYVRRHIFPGRVNFLANFRTVAKAHVAFIRQQRNKKVFDILKFYFAQCREKWCASRDRKRLHQVFSHLSQMIWAADQSSRMLRSCSFHFQLRKASLLLHRLRDIKYERCLLRETCVYRRVENLRLAYQVLFTHNVCMRNSKLASRKFRLSSASRMLNLFSENLFTMKLVQKAQQLCTFSFLKKSFTAFVLGCDSRRTFHVLLQTTKLKYIRIYLSALRKHALLCSVLRRLSHTFHFRKRGNYFFSKLLLICRGRQFSRRAIKISKDCRSHYLRKFALSQFIGSKYTSTILLMLANSSRTQYHTYKMKTVLLAWHRRAKQSGLNRVMDNGSAGSLRKEIRKCAFRGYGIRSEYIMLTPASVVDARRIFHWSRLLKLQSISNAVISDDSSTRNRLLKLVISRQSVIKRRFMSQIWKARKLSIHVKNCSHNGVSHNRNLLTLRSLRALYVYQLYRSRHKSRLKRILVYAARFLFHKQFRTWKRRLYFRKVRRTFYATHRLRKNALISFRYLRDMTVSSKKKATILLSVKRKWLLRTLYRLSKEKELNGMLVDFVSVSKRYSYYHLTGLFFKRLTPIVNAKKKLKRVCRCFYLRTCIRLWIERTAIELQVAKMYSCSIRNFLHGIFDKWNAYVVQSQLIIHAYHEVKRRVERRKREESLISWVEGIYRTRLLERYDTVQKNNCIAKIKFVFRYWHHRAIFKEVELWRKAKNIFSRLLELSRSRKEFICAERNSDVFYLQRNLSLVFRLMRYRHRELRHLQAKCDDVKSSLLLRKCLNSVKSWIKLYMIRTSRSKLIYNYLLTTVLDNIFRLRQLKKIVGFTNKFSVALDIRKNTRYIRQGFCRWRLWVAKIQSIRTLKYMQLHFESWKLVVSSNHLRRLAFAARLQSVWVKETMRFGLQGFIQNVKFGRVMKIAKYRHTHFFHKTWIAKCKNRQKLRETFTAMNTAFRKSEMQVLLNYWKLMSGPAIRFERRFFFERIFNRWHNITLSKKHYRFVTFVKVLNGWRDVVIHKGRARRDVRRGRHLLLNLITKMLQQNRFIVSQAFQLWCGGACQNSLVKIKVLESERRKTAPDIISFTPFKRIRKFVLFDDKQQKKSVEYMQTWRNNVDSIRKSRSRNTANFRLQSRNISDLSHSAVASSLNISRDSLKTPSSKAVYLKSSVSNISEIQHDDLEQDEYDDEFNQYDNDESDLISSALGHNSTTTHTLL